MSRRKLKKKKKSRSLSENNKKEILAECMRKAQKVLLCGILNKELV